MWNDQSFDTSTALAIDGSQHKFQGGGKYTEYMKKSIEVKQHYRGNNSNASMNIEESTSFMPSLGFLKSNRIQRQTEQQITNISTARLKMKESINKDLMNLSHAASKFFDVEIQD